MILMSLSLIVAIGRYTILPFIVLGAIFQTRRIYKDNKRIGRGVILKMLLTIMLLLISALTALVKPPTWWIHWIGSTSFHFSLLFAYFTIEQYINNKFNQEIIKNKMFVGLVLLSLVRIYLEFKRRNNLVSFMENEIPLSTFDYYISTFLHYLPALFLSSIITNLYWQNIRKAKLTSSYLLRRIICMIGFTIITFAFFCLTLTIPLALFVTDEYRPLLNSTYHIGKPIVIILLLIGMTLPNSLFTSLVWTIEKYLNRRDKEQYKLLEYLMHCYNTIVPMQQYQSRVKRSSDYVMPLKRINASIGDGRLIALSHKPFGRLNARKEAKYLALLLRNRVVYETPGQYSLPPFPGHATKYNIQVSRHLKRLQHQRHWMFIVSKFLRQGKTQ